MAVKENTTAAFTVDYLAFADSLDDIKNYVSEKSDTGLCAHLLSVKVRIYRIDIL